LFRRIGLWAGTLVVSRGWVARATQGDDPCSDWYRYLWHQNPPIRLGVQADDCPELRACEPLELADIPPDTFFAAGINGQFIFVIPAADMVVVRTASDAAGSENWDAYSREFIGLVLDAVM
jgi:CubicO group peptidase (beta-lactamase class C family)